MVEGWKFLGDIIFGETGRRPKGEPQGVKKKIGSVGDTPIYAYDHEGEFPKPPDPIPFDSTRKSRNRVAS